MENKKASVWVWILIVLVLLGIVAIAFFWITVLFPSSPYPSPPKLPN